MNREETIMQLESLKRYYIDTFGKQINDPDEGYDVFKKDLEALESAIALLEKEDK